MTSRCSCEFHIEISNGKFCSCLLLLLLIENNARHYYSYRYKQENWSHMLGWDGCGDIEIQFFLSTNAKRYLSAQTMNSLTHSVKVSPVENLSRNSSNCEYWAIVSHTPRSLLPLCPRLSSVSPVNPFTLRCFAVNVHKCFLHSRALTHVNPI